MLSEIFDGQGGAWVGLRDDKSPVGLEGGSSQGSNARKPKGLEDICHGRKVRDLVWGP